MKTIYKYALAVEDEQDVPMPKGAELLHVDVQQDQACLWARVDDQAETATRRIIIHGTGHPAGDEPYVGSFMILGGSFVGHVFDGGER